MKLKITFSLVLIIIVCSFVYSSNKYEKQLDSLINSNKQINEIKLLDSLSRLYRYTDLEFAIFIANRFLSKIENEKIDSATISSLVNISTIYRQNNNFSKALELLNISTINAIKSKNMELLWKIFNNKGNVYRYDNNMNEAIKAYYTSLKIAEKINDKGAIAASNNNIGSVYFTLQRFEDALKYFLQSYKFYSETVDVDPYYTAAMADNIGMVYNELKQYDKALAYHLQAKKGFEKTDNLGAKSMNIISISNVLINKKLFNEALTYIDKAVELSGNSNSLSLILARNTKAVILHELARYKEAEELSLMNISYYDSIKSTFGLHELYYELTKNYIKQNSADNALKYLSLYRHLNDSINSSELNSEVAGIEAKYETEKKEQQIALLEKDKKNKQLIIYSTSVGLFLLFILVFITFKGYRDKKNSNKTLTLQNNIIQNKNKDITDSINYAQRIQLAIQPSIKQLKTQFQNSFILYKPKDIVSGDFFWFTQQGNNLFIAAADCTGHGVPGALMSMIGMNFLNQLVVENKLTDTAIILNKLHNKVKEALASNTEEKRESNDGMDIALIKINKAENNLQFSGAVRPFYYFENNTLYLVKGDRYSIGGIKDEVTPFISHSFKLNSLQSFYLFSDGFADQFGGNSGKKFMLKNFQNLLVSIQELSIEEQENDINNAFMEWKGQFEQVDDILVMGFKNS